MYLEYLPRGHVIGGNGLPQLVVDRGICFRSVVPQIKEFVAQRINYCVCLAQTCLIVVWNRGGPHERCNGVLVARAHLRLYKTKVFYDRSRQL